MLQCSPRYARVRVKAAAMHSPCTTRSAVKTPRFGATASSAVGSASKVRAMRMPRRRSIWRLNQAIPRPAAAMPIVVALTAKLMAAGVTP